MFDKLVGSEPTCIASVARIVVVIAGIGGFMLSYEQATALALAAYLIVEVVTTLWNRSKVSPVPAPPLPYESIAPVVTLASRRPPPGTAA